MRPERRETQSGDPADAASDFTSTCRRTRKLLDLLEARREGKPLGVTFPLLAKTDVNGADRHPLYAELTQTPDGGGEAGDVQWNFEKFLLAPGGQVVNRFRPRTEPDAPEVISAIEAVLPK